MPEHDDWDRHWERYAASASRNPAQRMRHELIARLLRRGLAEGGSNILDLGSGQGDLLAKLGKLMPAARLVGFDLSASGVAQSREKVPAADFFVADLLKPPLEIKPYFEWANRAVCSEVLEHMDDPAGFLRAAKAYLAAGALLIVTVPGGPMSAFDRHIGHRRHFTRKSVGRVLREAGFAVERVYLAGFPFFNLYRAAVIARGGKLAADVETGRSGGSALLANAVMAGFRGLFRFNLIDFPFGWQVLAVARKLN
jgi:SAM-dependent methyltransferase